MEGLSIQRLLLSNSRESEGFPHLPQVKVSKADAKLGFLFDQVDETRGVMVSEVPRTDRGTGVRDTCV